MSAPAQGATSPVPRASVGKSFLALGAGRLLPLAVTVIALAAVAARLQPSRFGVLATALATVSLASSLVDAGMLTASAREASRNPTNRDELFHTLITARAVLLAAASIAMVATWIWVLPPMPHRVVNLCLSLLQLAGTVAAGSYLMLAQVDGRIGDYAKRDAAGRMIAGLAILVAVAMTPRDTLLTSSLGLIAAGPIMSALLLRRCFGAEPSSRSLKNRLLGAWQLFRGSSALAAAYVLNTIYFRVDALLLIALSSSREAGLYGLAFRIFEVLLMVGGFYQGALLPVASQLERAGLRTATLRGLRRMLLLGIPTLTIGVALAPALVRFAGGAGYADAAGVLLALLPGAVLAWMNSVGGIALVAAGAERRALVVNVSVTVLNLTANVLLIPHFGALGAALVNTASEVLAFSLMLWLFAIVLELHLRVPKRRVAGGVLLTMWWLGSQLLITSFAARVGAALGFALVGMRVVGLPSRSSIPQESIPTTSSAADHPATRPRIRARGCYGWLHGCLERGGTHSD